MKPNLSIALAAGTDCVRWRPRRRHLSVIQTYESINESTDYRIKAQSFAGSVENLRKVDQGRMQFGVMNSRHLHIRRADRLKNDGKNTKSTGGGVSLQIGRPVVLRKDSGIARVQDPEGKKVGVGSAGPGAFAKCKLSFTHLGI